MELLYSVAMKNSPPILVYVVATLGVGIVSGLMGLILTPNKKPSRPAPVISASASQGVEGAALQKPVKKRAQALAPVPLEIAQHKNPASKYEGMVFTSDGYRGVVKMPALGEEQRYIITVNGVERFNQTTSDKSLQDFLGRYPAVRPLLHDAGNGYRLLLWSQLEEAPSAAEVHAALASKDDPDTLQWALESVARMQPEEALAFLPDILQLADSYLPLPLGGLAAVKRIGIAAVPQYHEAMEKASPLQATNIAQFILALGNAGAAHVIEFIDSYEDNAFFLNAMSRYFLFENRQFTAANRQLIKERLNLIPLPELPDDVAYALNSQPSFTAIELKKVSDGLEAEDWGARAEAITFSANAVPRLSLAQKEQISALLAAGYLKDKQADDAAHRQIVLVTYHNAFSKIGALPESLLARFRKDAATSDDNLLKGMSAAQLLLYELSPKYRAALLDSLSDTANVGAYIPQLVKASPRVVEYLVPELVTRIENTQEVSERGILLAFSEIMLRRDTVDALGRRNQADSAIFGRVPTARERVQVRQALRPLVPVLQNLLKDTNDDIRILAATVLYRINPADAQAKILLRACARSAPLAEKKAHCAEVQGEDVPSN